MTNSKSGNPQLNIIVSGNSSDQRQRIYIYLKKYLDIQRNKFTFYRNIATLGLNYMTTSKLDILPENKTDITRILSMIKESSSTLVNEIIELYNILIHPSFDYNKVASFKKIINKFKI